jgi:hypothetical protein
MGPATTSATQTIDRLSDLYGGGFPASPLSVSQAKRMTPCRAAKKTTAKVLTQRAGHAGQAIVGDTRRKVVAAGKGKGSFRRARPVAVGPPYGICI